ncbi:phytoene/squalene synthase family protein [Tenggerimyces flavus]|uniref:Phytoene/squalene synthase family protein n=1 Tax=Tenggerimyces flavus TaxID=1708749 RepID=A0ABV7YFM9_9ACTN|nr:phytoene/squalene synthase family protein [Tenggerimyces flavus]MBM7783935.1 phytoene synthase [Tenggerimyces flavus]
MTSLRESYLRCAQIARRHGKTYSTAAYLLTPSDRRHVFAIYAFCRVADDIVDEATDRPTEQTAAALAEFGDRFRTDLAAGTSSHPLLAAVVRTARELQIDPECFDRFLRSMTMDLTTSSYATWDDLVGYMDGSAAVIGEMMLPVLHPLTPEAFEPSRQLGVAFQLTNFLRDVGEDLDRGRLYLPREDLDRFDADPHTRRVDDPWRALMRFEIERTRAIYREADKGIPLLPRRSARCVATARILYSRILDRIEANDYDVFTRRARVPSAEKLWVAARSLLSPTAAG